MADDEAPPLLVQVEYCSSCGFRAKAVDLQEALEAAFGNAVDVEIGAGRPKSFEIKAGGEEVHSKLQSKQWPKHSDVLDAVKARLGARAAAGAEQAVAAARQAEEAKEARDAEAAMSPAAADDLVARLTAQHAVVVFSKSYCPYCKKAKETLKGLEQPFYLLELDQNPSGEALQEALARATGQKTVPNVFVHGRSIGGGDDTARLAASGELAAMVRAGRGGKGGAVAVEMGQLKQRGAASAAAAGAATAAYDAEDLPPKTCLPLWAQWPLFFFPYNLNIAVARSTAVLNVLLCVVVAVWADKVWARYLCAAIAGDFFLRVLFGGRGSVLGTLGDLIAQWMPHSMTPGPPKQFAQMIGLVMSGAATAFLWADRGNDDFELVARVLIGVLAFFAGLEGFANFCAGCWMFGLAVKFGLVRVDPSIRCDKVAGEQHHTLDWIRRRLRQPPPRAVVSHAGPGKVPLLYKQKNDDHKKEDFHLVRHAHITFGGMHMGLAGVALVFKLAAMTQAWNVPRSYWVGTGVFAATVYCAWLALFLLKCAFYPGKVVKEWHHPIKSNFFAGNTLVPVIYAFLVHDELERLSRVLFWVCSPTLLAMSLVLMARWVSKWHYRGLIHAVWMVPPVGNLVVAVVMPFVGQANGHDYQDAAYLWYSMGLLMWVFLTTMVLQRSFFGAFHKDQMRSTLWILVAAPAVASVAHLAVTGQLQAALGGAAPLDEFALVLYYFALNMALMMLVLVLTGYVGRYRYELSYWAFVFPLAALSLAALVYHNATRTRWTNAQAVASFALTLTAAFMNLAHTLVMLAERRGFVPEQKFGPMAFFSKLQHYAMRENLRQMNALSRKLHRPEKLEEFAHAFHLYNFVHKMHAEYEETILFPELDKFFRGVARSHHSEHEHAHGMHDSLERLLDELVPGAREDVLARYNYYATPADREAAKRRAFGVEEGAALPAGRHATKAELNRLVELGQQVEQDSNEHFDSEEENIGHVLTKYFNSKLGKKVAQKVWNAYPSDTWRVVVPYTVKFQDLHGRRLKALKSLQMVLPERMHQVGQYVYEAIDDVTWDRVKVDVPEMIPRHVQGYQRIF